MILFYGFCGGKNRLKGEWGHTFRGRNFPNFFFACPHWLSILQGKNFLLWRKFIPVRAKPSLQRILLSRKQKQTEIDRSYLSLCKWKYIRMYQQKKKSRCAVGSASVSRARGLGFDTRPDHLFSLRSCLPLPLLPEDWRKNVHLVLANHNTTTTKTYTDNFVTFLLSKYINMYYQSTEITGSHI